MQSLDLRRFKRYKRMKFLESMIWKNKFLHFLRTSDALEYSNMTRHALSKNVPGRLVPAHAGGEAFGLWPVEIRPFVTGNGMVGERQSQKIQNSCAVDIRKTGLSAPSDFEKLKEKGKSLGQGRFV